MFALQQPYQHAVEGGPRTARDVKISADKLRPKPYDEIRQRVEEERSKAPQPVKGKR